jgi:hypothetical protein
MLKAERAYQVVLAMLVAVAATVVAASAARASGQAQLRLGPSDQTGFVQKIDNPYFPLAPGTTDVYTGSKDRKKALEFFEVTNKTKMILGVACTTIHDRLYLDGFLAEDTWDWYAQDRAGTVWYFGEATKELDPAGHVISTEGSFQAGLNGARQGIFMPARPVAGTTYQQEFYKGHAEDHFKILNLSSSVTVPAGTFQKTLLTSEWTPLEPAVLSEKNFARGIGTVAERDIKGSNEHLELAAVLHG